MQIKLHIGFHKCGSTALQFAMAQSRSALAAAGVVYPSAHCVLDAHHRLAWSLSGRKIPGFDNIPAEQLFEAWLAEAVAQQAEMMVLSSEDFEFLAPPAVERLGKLLQGHQVEIYVYLRPQDEYLIAEYKQHVRMMDTAFGGTIDEFYARYLYEMSVRFDYPEIVGRWADRFGIDRVKVTSYYRPGLIDGDILADFAAAGGLPAFAMPSAREHNVTWTNLTTLIFAKLNVIGFSPETRVALSRDLDLVVAQKQLEVELLTAAKRNALISKHRASNAKLLAAYQVRGDAGRLLDREIAPGVPQDETAAINAVLLQFIADVICRAPPS